MTSPIPFVFFGTGNIARAVLQHIEGAGLTPSLIVTAPDRPIGRGLEVRPSPVGVYAAERRIPLLTPAKLDSEFSASLVPSRGTSIADVFVVVDYGLIIPKTVIEMPKLGILNMHPSLLPKLRGPSPIRSAILEDAREDVGVTVMLLDEKMDHGPILAQRKVELDAWPPSGAALDELLACEGGVLLAEVLPRYVAGKIEPHPQSHEHATYTKLFTKEDGRLDLVHGDPRANFLKIRAFEGWPGTYAFFKRPEGKELRVGIVAAHLDGSGALILDRVKPEGKREMSYDDFARSGSTPQ